MASSIEEYLLGEVDKGEIILIEHSSRVPIEDLSWSVLMPSLTSRGGVVVLDFFGVGSLLFRNYERKAPGKDYKRLLETMKGLKVVQIGPSVVNYGEVLETIVPSEDSRNFLKNYHAVISRISKLPRKPKYMVVFGFGEYIYFGGDTILKNLLTALATIPLDDWAVLAFINVDVLKKEQLALLESISSAAFHITKGGIEIRKVKRRGERE